MNKNICSYLAFGVVFFSGLYIFTNSIVYSLIMSVLMVSYLWIFIKMMVLKQ